MSRKLFVGNLPYSVTSERLQEAFSQFGTVSSSKVIVDRETGRSRGFAFLEMETDDQGAAAMQAMNGALLDGRSIAWHIGLTFRRRMYWWIPAHDQAWQSHSPGKVLLALLIERAIASGVEELHLLTGAHRYKVDWKADVVTLSTLRWHAPSAKGTALAWYDAGRQFISR